MQDIFRTPGVYVDEVDPPAPIQGVGTSTAAFVGIAALGEINEPTKVTSFDRFKQLYGSMPVPGTHLWYAVRAFYANGGRVCHIVRASNGRAASWDIDNTNGDAVVRLVARVPGAGAMTVAVADASLLPATPLYRPEAQALATAQGAREIAVQADGAVPDVDVAGRFRPGDFLNIGALPDRPQVVAVSTNTIRISTPVSAAVAAGTAIILAPIQPGDTTFRLEPPVPLVQGVLLRGTILTVTQGAGTATQVVRTVSAEPLPEGITTYRVTLRMPVGTAFSLDPGDAAIAAQSREHTVTFSAGGANTVFDTLSMDPAHPRFLVRVIEENTGGPLRARPVEPPPPAALPDSLPVAAAAVGPTIAGANEDLLNLTTQPFIDGIEALAPVDDVNMLCVPDRPTAAGAQMLPVQQAMITHCETLADRFAILDSGPGLAPFGVGGVEGQRAGLDSARGYAALYYPWLRQRTEGGGPSRLTPPCGHVAGIFARADAEVGVHKSPANYIVSDALAVERRLSDRQQGEINIQGVNVIRVFQEAGRPVLWGARTTSPDTVWRYVAVRRLFLFLEESIQEGIRHAIFDVHTPGLRKKVKRSIDDFLEAQWRAGALFGDKPEDAFKVRIDDDLNPFSQMQLGIMTIEVGVQPAFPVEFIWLRIGIAEGGSLTLEEV